jgi:hypothetical protein
MVRVAGAAGLWRRLHDARSPPTSHSAAPVAEQLYVRDDHGQQAVDTVQPGPGNVIGNVALGGNATSLKWTHRATWEQFALR